MLVLHYIRTGGFAPVRCINVLAASIGVMQRVGEITSFSLAARDCLTTKNYKAMEKNSKIQLKPVVFYDVDEADLFEIYAHFSLIQYQWLRKPDYNKRLALEVLRKDLRRFLLEMQLQVQRDPNNKNISNIQVFFERHYNRLNGLLGE